MRKKARLVRGLVLNVDRGSWVAEMAGIETKEKMIVKVPQIFQKKIERGDIWLLEIVENQARFIVHGEEYD